MMISVVHLLMMLTSLLGTDAMSLNPVGPGDTAEMKMSGNNDVTCVIPPEDDLIRILIGSENVYAHIPGDTEQDKDSKEAIILKKNQTLESNLHCPVGERLPKSAPVRLRSVCPWELLDDIDSNRYPKILQKAVCRCSNCLDPSTSQPNDKHVCTPVYYPMPVLRRTGCKDGMATFEPRFEQVPVACDCRAKTTGHSNVGINKAQAF